MNQVAGGLDTLLGQDDPRTAEDALLPGFGGLTSTGDSLFALPCSFRRRSPPWRWRWLAENAQFCRQPPRVRQGRPFYTTLEEPSAASKIVKAFTNERQERNRYHKNAKHT